MSFLRAANRPFFWRTLFRFLDESVIASSAEEFSFPRLTRKNRERFSLLLVRLRLRCRRACRSCSLMARQNRILSIAQQFLSPPACRLCFRGKRSHRGVV